LPGERYLRGTEKQASHADITPIGLMRCAIFFVMRTCMLAALNHYRFAARTPQSKAK
jgi:hypothetical protein